MGTTSTLNQSTIFYAFDKSGLKLDIRTGEKAGAAIRSVKIRVVLLTMLGAFCFALAPVWVRLINALSPVSIVSFAALCSALFRCIIAPISDGHFRAILPFLIVPGTVSLVLP